MRNRFAGTCYRCNERVEPGDGHFERIGFKWRVQHATCAIECRGVPDPSRQAHQIAKWKRMAEGTGKSAQQARRRLRAALAEKEQSDV